MSPNYVVQNCSHYVQKRANATVCATLLSIREQGPIIKTCYVVGHTFLGRLLLTKPFLVVAPKTITKSRIHFTMFQIFEFSNNFQRDFNRIESFFYYPPLLLAFKSSCLHIIKKVAIYGCVVSVGF